MPTSIKNALERQYLGMSGYVWLVLIAAAVGLGLLLRKRAGDSPLYNAETFPIPGQIAPEPSDDPQDSAPPPAQANLVTVPNLIGMPSQSGNFNDAPKLPQITLHNAGLEYASEKLVGGIGLEHLHVVSQSPPAGTQVAKGTTVTVYHGR